VFLPLEFNFNLGEAQGRRREDDEKRNKQQTTKSLDLTDLGLTCGIPETY